MLKGLGDVGNLMKMQREMKNFQKKLKKTKIEGESSDGLVKAVVNGEYRIVDISIDKSLVDNGDTKKIEKTVMAAVNDAVAKIMDYSTSEMSKVTGGMDLSSFMK